MKKYLFFVSLSYSYSILRPLQDEIWRRGDEVAWFIEKSSPVCLHDNEKHLKTIEEVMKYNPIAIFVPGPRVYDFFPGIKVQIFHGLYFKRTDLKDHYKIRGFFDVYCTTSTMFFPRFKELEKKYGYFKVYNTGWCKFDSFPSDNEIRVINQRPTILYAPTFTLELTSATDLYLQIEELIKIKEWDWIFSFHPKMKAETIAQYKQLADKYENAIFCDSEDKVPLYKKADVMLSDTSSIIYEFLWFNKPVVTYKNTFPANHLLNIDNPDLLEQAIDKALENPSDLMKNIKEFMEEVHPFRDGKASVRVLDATDDFIKNYKGKIKKKPFNFFRKLKVRQRVGHFYPISFRG